MISLIKLNNFAANTSLIWLGGRKEPLDAIMQTNMHVQNHSWNLWNGPFLDLCLGMIRIENPKSLFWFDVDPKSEVWQPSNEEYRGPTVSR